MESKVGEWADDVNIENELWLCHNAENTMRFRSALCSNLIRLYCRRMNSLRIQWTERRAEV